MTETEFLSLPPCLVELHLHLDGSLSPATVRTLAEKQGVAIPQDDATLDRLLSVRDGCRDLNEYLEKFDFPLSLLQNAEAITYSVRRLCEELAGEGVIYAEIRFAPALHTRAGLAAEDAVKAACEGLRGAPIGAGLILCCMRGGRDEDNFRTADLAKKYLGSGVVACDLAGAEALFKTGKYKQLFAYMANIGVPFTIHAGEADGAESVREALSLGASRIGHGVRCVEDGALVPELVRRGIPLEVCPTSNVDTGVCSSLDRHPIRDLLTSGVCVTVNSDNRTVSGTTVREEFLRLIRAFSLTRGEVFTLLYNAAGAVFAPDGVKKSLFERIRRAEESLSAIGN